MLEIMLLLVNCIIMYDIIYEIIIISVIHTTNLVFQKTKMILLNIKETTLYSLNLLNNIVFIK